MKYNKSKKEEILNKQNSQINVDKSIEDFTGFLENENNSKIISKNSTNEKERNSIKNLTDNSNSLNFSVKNENEFEDEKNIEPEIIPSKENTENIPSSNQIIGNSLPIPQKLSLNSQPPYLPSLSLSRKPRKYTLVLDLDETLVHFVEENDSAFIQIRPGAETFLEEMQKYYEIVIFTAAMQDVNKNKKIN